MLEFFVGWLALTILLVYTVYKLWKLYSELDAEKEQMVSAFEDIIQELKCNLQ